MKNYLMALSLSVLLAACQQNDNADSKEAGKDEQKNSLIADQDKMSYAVGSNMADSVTKLNTQFKSLGLNSDVVKQGFLETMASSSGMTEDQIKQELQILQQKIQAEHQQQSMEAQLKAQQKDSLSEEQMAAKTAENKLYMDKMEAEGFSKTESGLLYKVLQKGAEGAAKPTATDTVLVNYAGTFTDGSPFDSNAGGKPFSFSLRGGVIQGWLEGGLLMEVGSKVKLIVPPELGYGFQSRGPIPAGSVLIFDIEMLEIVAPEKSASAAKE